MTAETTAFGQHCHKVRRATEKKNPLYRILIDSAILIKFPAIFLNKYSAFC